MPAEGYSEDALVEQPTLQLLRALGWETICGYDEHPGSGGSVGRSTFAETILPERLRLALRDINPGRSEEAVEQAVEALSRDRSAMMGVQANYQIWQLLRDGFDAVTATPEGRQREEHVDFVHWNDTGQNDFLAVNQFWVTGPLHRRRADIVLFVNGIPLVLLELKASHRRVEDGYRENIRDYRDTIPQLFWGNGFVVVSNGSEAKVGATFAEWEHFTDWKKVESESEEGRVALETALQATCRPDRVLDLVENFTVFQEMGGGLGLVKKFAKNHQYLGVNNALEALRRVGDDPGRLGVFWHTQGSGKSLSMIFFAQKVLRKEPGGWTFVLVTDRRELDRQLYGEFKSAGAVTGVEVQATSSVHLRQLLAEDHRYVFTLIHKFRPQSEDEAMDVLSDRRNVIVMTDEAHRSQYAQLALNMRTALPNAAFLGFTGTPLIAGDVERTREVFGEYLSVYSWSDAQTDEVAVPLFYENRTPELQIVNERFAEDFADILDEAVASEDEDATEAQLARRFATEYQLITRPERLRSIATDLVDHFAARGFDGKAMYVGIDKATAVRMHDLVRGAWAEHLADLESRRVAADDAERIWLDGRIEFMRTTDMAVVVSQGQNELADLDAEGLDIRPHRQRMNDDDLETKFKDPDDPFRLVFVCAMWMTGFDVPSCSTIYLDRPMRNHTLMQTIARANRVFPEKENGLIVDYVGVFRNIEAALAVYGTGPGRHGEERPIESKEELLAALDASVEECADLCNRCDVDIETLLVAEGFGFIQLRDLAVESLLVDPDQKRVFLASADRCRSLLKAVMPDPIANAHLRRVGVYRNLAEKIRGDVVMPDLSGLADAVDELLDRSVGAEAYVIQTQGEAELSPQIDLGLIDFGKLEEIYGGRKHTAADRLAQLLRHRASDSAARNPTRLEFVRRVEEVIDEYNAGSLNIDEYLRRLIRLSQDLNEDQKRVVAEGMSEAELAIFDLLTRPGPNLTEDERETVKGIARHLLDTITEKLVLDWRKRQRSRSAVRVAVGQALDSLPEAFDDALFEEKRNAVFDHLLTSFFDDGRSVYNRASPA